MTRMRFVSLIDWVGLEGLLGHVSLEGLLEGCRAWWAGGSGGPSWFVGSNIRYGVCEWDVLGGSWGSGAFGESVWLGGSGWSGLGCQVWLILGMSCYSIWSESIFKWKYCLWCSKVIQWSPKSSMIQKELQLGVWTLIIQKSMVISPSWMVLFNTFKIGSLCNSTWPQIWHLVIYNVLYYMILILINMILILEM